MAFQLEAYKITRAISESISNANFSFCTERLRTHHFHAALGTGPRRGPAGHAENLKKPEGPGGPGPAPGHDRDRPRPGMPVGLRTCGSGTKLVSEAMQTRRAL
jgi:hypothetical protein